MTPETYDFTEFLDFDAFKKTFEAQGEGSSNICLIIRAKRDIEKRSVDSLLELFHALTGKWPLQTSKEALVTTICRVIQTKFYSKLFDKEPTEQILQADQGMLALVGLGDNKPVISKQKPQPRKRCEMESEKETAQEAKETTQEETKKTAKKPKSEFSQKISSMSIEDIIKWAQELGVPTEKIDRHKDKPLGLAKMNLGNLIRPKLKKT